MRCLSGWDRHIHILGSVQNIKIARDAIVSLILGSPPGKSFLSLLLSILAYTTSHTLTGKVYAHLRAVGARLKQRF